MILLPGVQQARAQTESDLVLYPLGIEGILNYDRTDQHSSTGSAGRSRETELEIGARVTQQGHYLDPEIAWFLLDFEPLLTRNDVDSGTIDEDSDGESIDYLMQLGVFRGTPDPLGYNVYLQRNSSLSTGSLGSRSDNVIDNNKVSVNWKNPPFPMTFSYAEETLDQEFRNSQNNLVSLRDEKLETLSIDGNSSKMDVRLTHSELDDRIASRNNDFEVDQLLANHRLSWGRNSELTSRLDLYDREGFNANQRESLDETARITHTENVYSRLVYRYFSLTRNVETEEHLLKFDLNHQLYQNLTSTASVSIETSDSDNLDETVNGLDLSSRYQKQDLFGSRVNAGIGLGYLETDRDSSLGLVDVADERHEIPLGGAVTLNNRFIVASSIIVTNADATLVFDLGTDYEVVSLTGDLTEVRVVPGSRIAEGDTILVSYQFQILPSQKYTTERFRYHFSIDRQWWRFAHADNRSNDTLKSGADSSFLNDSRLTRTDLEFRLKVGGNDALLSAERQYREISGFESTRYTYQQSLSWVHSKSLRWNLSLTESFTEQVNRDSDLYSMDFLVDWRPNPQLSVRPVIGFWRLKDTATAVAGTDSDDEFTTAGVRLHWQFRRIVMDFSLFHNEREVTSSPAGSIRTREDRLMLNLRRRFQ